MAQTLIKTQNPSGASNITFIDGTSDVVFDGTYPMYICQYTLQPDAGNDAVMRLVRTKMVEQIGKMLLQLLRDGHSVLQKVGRLPAHHLILIIPTIMLALYLLDNLVLIVGKTVLV